MHTPGPRAALPIAAFERAIVDAVARGPGVCIVAGDTGCGKSTQVPQFLLRAGLRSIACTQPRRVAAVALARRVARETLTEHSDEVAYQVRFESSRDARRTRVLFLTEGLLLRQLRSDPELRRFDVVLVEEVHERHAAGDVLLALLLSLIHI